ncbi:MAG: ABC transporter ATP-binding protein [Oligoflexales bacterium]|nr:ABC transporter ATP-binding protein [Oligoflexales bacterium]
MTYLKTEDDSSRLSSFSSSQTAYSIVFSDVYKTYTLESQKVEALAGVDIKIPRGYVAAVTGKSGAGKSTFLHIAGTLDLPTSGAVFLNGIDILKMNDRALSHFRNATVGFVFQMNNLFSEFSALENVMIPGLISGAPAASVRERAKKVLTSVGLSKRLDHRPGELSGGEQQRVAIARALFMGPRILLADEPTGNLDKKTSQSIEELLLSLCVEYKMTLLLVTHDLELANRLPYQIAMEDGRIVDRGH